MNDLAEVRVLAADLDHPEGIALGPDGAFYAGGEAGQVYRFEAGGTPEVIAETGGSLLGVCLDRAGSVYVCDTVARAVLRIADDGRPSTYCAAAGGTRLRLPNWAAFDDAGALWLSDSGTEDVAACDGTLVCVPPGGGDGDIVELPPLHFPNGLCIDADGAVCVLESFTPRLRRLVDGELRPVAELPGIVPDGVAAEAGGGFVVSCYYPFRVLRVDPAGQVETLLDDPLGQTLVSPTNVAHHGDGLDELAFASLLGRTVTGCPAPAPGLRLRYP